jgi:hypothetical protein
MPAEFGPAPQYIVDLARELIDLYHSELKEVRIGLLVRDEAPISGGVATLGKARKVGPEEQALYDHPYDFVIWFAKDQWVYLSQHQKRALVDHELCHCRISYDKDGEQKLEIAKHDLEEFNVILERYGFWHPGGAGKQTERAVQKRFDFEHNGVLEAARLKSEESPGTDIIDQVDDLLKGGGEDANS